MRWKTGDRQRNPAREACLFSEGKRSGISHPVPVFPMRRVLPRAARGFCDEKLTMEPVRIPISDVFDLHSVPPGDAEAVVEEYLKEARRLGLKALRIIHGRGIGVQRQMVRTVLARTEFVAEYGDAPAEAGGWGATLVTLR